MRKTYKGDRVRIDKDTGYGVDKRNGWSIAIDGAYIVQLEPWLVVAIWKAWRWMKAEEKRLKAIPRA